MAVRIEAQAGEARTPLFVRRRIPWKRLRRIPGIVLASIAILFTMVILAVLAPQVAPYDPLKTNLAARLVGPALLTGDGSGYVFGTDGVGRDVLSRIIFGARISLVVGLGTVLVGGFLGSLLGLLSGYFARSVDSAIMMAADIQLSFPFLLLGILIMAILGPGTLNVILVLALIIWVPFARVMRSQVLSIKEKEFIAAARAIGAGAWRLLIRHLLPNTVSSIIVIGTLELARAVVVESTLSFLGLGVKPPEPSWGVMLADGRQYIGTAWWVAALPGLAILLTCLSANILGDWARDVLDPTLRHENFRA